jgi:hypothetical protein
MIGGEKVLVVAHSGGDRSLALVGSRSKPGWMFFLSARNIRFPLIDFPRWFLINRGSTAPWRVGERL